MSDAITLDVLSSSPVQLDVGDADPIAREEIAALAGRVTTVEGDVTALDGRLDTAEGDISTLGTTVDGIDARVEAIEADYVTSEDVMGALGGEAPTLVAGSSRALLGDAETASWMERTTAADGAALIEAVYGNTLRWNQLVPTRNSTETANGITMTATNGVYTVTGTGTLDSGLVRAVLATMYVPVNHKVYASIRKVSTGETNNNGISVADGYAHKFNPNFPTQDASTIFECTTGTVRFCTQPCLTTLTMDMTLTPQLFDLTQMFGSGNEPATVAEFEAMFPEPHYPYDPGSLLPVRMEGVETVAADESWSYQRTIPAATYFPDGMRSAGTVRDELTATQAITRVGERAYQSGDESDASVITDGTVTHYALATPVTTLIDPPLPLSYRVGAGGTERVMVASGTTSAPPIFATRYPLDPADLAASIAPRESATAEANHAVGDLIMLGWTLCKVTTAIARGEAITIGTNVTRTSVAAELAALSE